MCCYRDLKNFDRFNCVIRSLIFLVVSKLKDIKTLIINTERLDAKIVEINVSVKRSNESSPVCGGSGGSDKEKEDLPPPAESSDKSTTAVAGGAIKADDIVDSDAKKSKSSGSSSDSGGDVKKVVTTTTQQPNDIDGWILPELEKVLIFISKIFLLNFPLYMAHKHGVHGRIDEMSQQELQSLSTYCDIHDTEIPVYLYRNVSLFCSLGGFNAMTQCFELTSLPVSTAHACTVAISNVKLWLNYRSIITLFVPLRVKVLQYMCKLSDQDLRSPATKSMAGKSNEVIELSKKVSNCRNLLF